MAYATERFGSKEVSHSAHSADDTGHSHGSSESEEHNGEGYAVVSADGSRNLNVTVDTDQATGASTITGQGTASVGDDGKTVQVSVKVDVGEDGQVTASVDTQGADLTEQESQQLIADIMRDMAVDLLPVAPISNEAYQGMLSVSEGATGPVSVTSNSAGGQTISSTALIEEGGTPEQRAQAETEFEQTRQSAASGYSASGGSAASYNGGGSGAPTSVDDGVIDDEELNGLASNNDFQFRSQGNVEGTYFTKTPDGIMAEVSTSDRRPGFWNGNRAEIAFNKKFRGGDTTGFRSFFDIHEGSNFSIFQLFNQMGGEGFPEAMVKVVDDKLVLGGRAFGGKNIVLGTLPEGRFGIDVKFSNGKVSVQLLDESGQAVGEGFTAAVTQPGGEFHYRAGPYFDGHNNKQFGSDMQNITAKVEIIDPVMIG